jgi:hypothetical protein
MDVGAAMVSADWVSLVSLWEAPINCYMQIDAQTNTIKVVKAFLQLLI